MINVPHPTVFEATLKSSPRQTRKSWYMFFFQVPRIPEWAQRRGDFARLVEGLQTAQEGTFTDEDIEYYRQAWTLEGALTGMLNWYRALFRAGEDGRLERFPDASHWVPHE